MSGVVCSSTAYKFVEEPSSYIVCQICKRVFTNPVINVKCGHTYCMTCLTKPSATGDCLSVVRCPEDGIECNVTELVLNRFFCVHCLLYQPLLFPFPLVWLWWRSWYGNSHSVLRPQLLRRGPLHDPGVCEVTVCECCAALSRDRHVLCMERPCEVVLYIYSTQPWLFALFSAHVWSVVV